MNLLAAHNHPKRPQRLSAYKDVWLNTASSGVIWFMCGGFPDGLARGSGGSRHKSAAWSFLVWLRIWLDWLCGGGSEGENYAPPQQSGINRRARRLKWRKIPTLRKLSLYRLLLGRYLSPAQFLEHVSKISPLGRVRLLSIPRWATREQYQAMLTCYDLGWWRAPFGVFGRVYCGVWQAHMWPGWLWWLCYKGNDVNQPAARGIFGCAEHNHECIFHDTQNCERVCLASGVSKPHRSARRVL